MAKKNPIAWLDNYTDTLWYHILFDDDKLRLDKDFILQKREREKPYKAYVDERLLSAAQSMISIPSEMIGINILLHTASSIILIEGQRERVNATLNFINTLPFSCGIDQTTVLTAISLYFLIRNAEYNFESKDNLEKFKYLHNRLDQMNWFIGDDGVKALGILRKGQCFNE